MKVLLISNICEQSGYSIAAEATLKSLYYNKIEVAARHMPLTGQRREVDAVVQKALKVPAADADFLLIHSLPSFFEYNGQFKKCIGKFDYETDFVPSNWKKKCQLMDEIWVSSEESKTDLDEIEHLEMPISVMPHAVDVNRFERDLSKCTGFIGRHKKKYGGYAFYTIGEFAPRKNYEALLQAWYLSFSQKDDVDLFIKTSMPGVEPGQAKVAFMNLCEEVKGNLKLNRRYLKDPVVITEAFDDLAIDTFHAEGDCFVSASHAEGMCMPARDAILFGKPCILPNHTAFSDYQYYPLVFSVMAFPVPCYGALNQPADIYNGSSIWYDVRTIDIKSWMQHCYTKRPAAKLDFNLINAYSYKTVGQQMIERLNV